MKPIDDSTKDRRREDARRSINHGIARGERAVAEGRVLSHGEARARLSRWIAPGGKAISPA